VSAHRIEAKVPVELHELFVSYCQARGFSPSEGVRVLVTRGLWRDVNDDPRSVDEAAFHAAYFNALTAIMGKLAHWLSPTGGFHTHAKELLSSVARDLGVEQF
jgi:hypothetical protein